MNTPNEPDKRLDDVFKRTLGESNVPFDPRAWVAMEKKLNADRDYRLAFWWRRGGLTLLALALLSMVAWYGTNRRANQLQSAVQNGENKVAMRHKPTQAHLPAAPAGAAAGANESAARSLPAQAGTPQTGTPATEITAPPQPAAKEIATDLTTTPANPDAATRTPFQPIAHPAVSPRRVGARNDRPTNRNPAGDAVSWPTVKEGRTEATPRLALPALANAPAAGRGQEGDSEKATRQANAPRVRPPAASVNFPSAPVDVAVNFPSAPIDAATAPVSTTTAPNNTTVGRELAAPVVNAPSQDGAVAERPGATDAAALPGTFGLNALTGLPVRLLPVSAAIAPPEAVAVTTPARRPPSRGSRLSVQVTLAPDLSTVGFGSFTRPATTQGVLLEYQLTPRLSVVAGALYSTKRYLATADDYTPVRPWAVRPDQVFADCRVIDLPLQLRYRVWQRPLGHWFVSTGVSSYLMQREVYEYRFATRPNGLWQAPDPANFWFGVANLSLGYERRVSQRLSLLVEPYLKLPLVGVGAGGVRLASTGAFFSVKYRFSQ